MTLYSTKGRRQRMSGTTSNKSRGDDTPCNIWMGKDPIFCDLVQGKPGRMDIGRRHYGRNIPLHTRLAVRRRSLLLGLILGTLKSCTGSARQSTPLSKREEPKTTIQVTRLRSINKTSTQSCTRHRVGYLEIRIPLFQGQFTNHPPHLDGLSHQNAEDGDRPSNPSKACCVMSHDLRGSKPYSWITL